MDYYGKYKAEVVDVADPEQRGRIRVKCPDVLGIQLSRWALPCFVPNTFTVPAKGTLVWVEFEGGNRDSPIWVGVFYTKEQCKNKFGAYSPDKYLVKSLGVTEILTAKDHITISPKTSLNISVTGEVNIDKRSE